MRKRRAQVHRGLVITGTRFVESDTAFARARGAGAGSVQADPEALRSAQGVPGSRHEARVRDACVRREWRIAEAGGEPGSNLGVRPKDVLSGKPR